MNNLRKILKYLPALCLAFLCSLDAFGQQVDLRWDPPLSVVAPTENDTVLLYLEPDTAGQVLDAITLRIAFDTSKVETIAMIDNYGWALTLEALDLGNDDGLLKYSLGQFSNFPTAEEVSFTFIYKVRDDACDGLFEFVLEGGVPTSVTCCGGLELVDEADSLLVNPSYYFLIDSTLCSGESLTIADTVFDADNPSGIINLQTQVSLCDSIYDVQLNFASCGKFYVSATATGNETGANWDDAFTDLQEAIDFASTNDIDTILVEQGTYLTGPSRTSSVTLKNSVKLFGGLTPLGLLDFQEDENTSVISADIGTPFDASDNSYHVVKVDSTCTDCEMHGFDLRDGQADGPQAIDQRGAGILNQGIATFKGVSISDCEAVDGGGAVFNTGAQTELTLFGVQVSNITSGQGSNHILNLDGATLSFEDISEIAN